MVSALVCLIKSHGLEFSCKGNVKEIVIFGLRRCFRLVRLVLMLAGLLLAYGVRPDPTLTILTAAAPGRGASLIMLIILLMIIFIMSIQTYY